MPSDSPFLLNFRDCIFRGENLFPQLVDKVGKSKGFERVQINENSSLANILKRLSRSEDRPIFVKKTKTLVQCNHPGLRNIGNSCYINVWIQTIFYCPMLKKIFSTGEPVSTTKPTLHNAMRDLFDLMTVGDGKNVLTADK
jgi:uncharacterized UBP type Zn finger protein